MSARIDPRKVLYPVVPVDLLMWGYFQGEIVPTVFNKYAVIPSREQVAAYIEKLEAFYAEHSDEEIAAINRQSESAWHEEQYKQDHADEQETKPVKQSPGFVYLVRSDKGYYKIGRTSDPKNRAKTFGVQLPFEIEFICLIKTDDMNGLESSLHMHYADKHVNGEWFALEPADVDYIKSLAVQS